MGGTNGPIPKRGKLDETKHLRLTEGKEASKVRKTSNMKQAKRYGMLNEDENSEGAEWFYLPYNQESGSCKMFRYDQLNN